jgi:hypothetical protein
MNRSIRTRIATAAVVAGALAVGAPAAPAAGAGFTLGLSQLSDPVVGQSFMLKATGTTTPPGDIDIPYWFSLDAIPSSVTSTCPPDAWEGVQFALDNFGALVVRRQREVTDAAGNFTIPVAVTPTSPGSWLLCGYTDDGAATTVAAASMLLNIKPAPASPAPAPAPAPAPQPGPATKPAPGGAAKPAPSRVSPALEAKRTIRGCRALLDGATLRHCIRRAIRHANVRCGHLRSRRSRTTCLRAVRRVGRSS